MQTGYVAQSVLPLRKISTILIVFALHAGVMRWSTDCELIQSTVYVIEMLRACARSAKQPNIERGERTGHDLRDAQVICG